MTEQGDQPQGTWTITVSGDHGWLGRLSAEFGGVVLGEQALLVQAMRHATWTPPPDERIERALEFVRNGIPRGGHHRLWIIDQMVRALTGCPMETRRAVDVRGREYSYEAQGENEAYSRARAGRPRVNRIREFVNRPLDTRYYSGWRWHLAVVRKWWLWYAFWTVFIAADIWWMASR